MERHCVDSRPLNYCSGNLCLEMQGIGKSFSGVPVLSGVDLAIHPGEVVALLGANGAGKSTLMKILAGFYHHDAGRVLINGSEVNGAHLRQIVLKEISFLPQEISIMPDMSVAENIAIGNLPLRRKLGISLIDKKLVRNLAANILVQLGSSYIHPDMLLGDLSVAEQRIVEIARAFASNASIIIMDEPTASLSEQESKMIFLIIRRLKSSMKSVFYISHYLKEVFEISDRIEVLRDGRNAGSFVTVQNSMTEVMAAMFGSVGNGLYAGKVEAKTAEDVLLTVRGMTTRSGLADISFELRRGEIFGVFGLVGSGVEHLGRALFGAQGKIITGNIWFNGQTYEPESPQKAKRVGIGFVTAERKKDGILGNLTIRQNLIAPFQSEAGRGIFASVEKEKVITRSWIDKLQIKTSGTEQEIQTLSGGNQQKICIARWLAADLHFLILDEPTRGIDIGARAELYRKFSDLARNGLTILVLSSDAEEIAGVSDRSIVIDRGKIIACFDSRAEPGALMAATSINVVSCVGEDNSLRRYQSNNHRQPDDLDEQTAEICHE